MKLLAPAASFSFSDQISKSLGRRELFFSLFLIAIIDRNIMKCLRAHSKCNLYHLSGETDVVFTSDDRQTQLADINAFENVKNIIGQSFLKKKNIERFQFSSLNVGSRVKVAVE